MDLLKFTVETFQSFVSMILLMKTLKTPEIHTDAD